MTTDDQLSAELSAAVVWLDLRPQSWCVFFSGVGPRGPYLDIAADVDGTTAAAILNDYQAEGFTVRLDNRAHIAEATGHRLRVRLHHGPQFRPLARSGAVRRLIFGQSLPVVATAAAEAA